MSAWDRVLSLGLKAAEGRRGELTALMLLDRGRRVDMAGDVGGGYIDAAALHMPNHHATVAGGSRRGGWGEMRWASSTRCGWEKFRCTMGVGQRGRVWGGAGLWVGWCGCADASASCQGEEADRGGRAKDAAALDASSWQNLEWLIELPGVDGRGARGGRKRKKEKEKHTNCPQMQRESRRGKETSSQLPGMGGMLNGREVIASGKDGVCVWAGSILHHLLARDIHGPKSSVLSTPASAASRLGAQSTNDDPHARLPAAMLWSRTATT